MYSIHCVEFLLYFFEQVAQSSPGTVMLKNPSINKTL